MNTFYRFGHNTIADSSHLGYMEEDQLSFVVQDQTVVCMDSLPLPVQPPLTKQGFPERISFNLIYQQ